MKNTKSLKVGMESKDAIKLDSVRLDKTYPEESALPEDDLYRFIYYAGKQHGDQKRRATNFIWSKNIYILDPVVDERGNCILYYLQGGPGRVFAPEELMHIPEYTKAPPEWVNKW